MLHRMLTTASTEEFDPGPFDPLPLIRFDPAFDPELDAQRLKLPNGEQLKLTPGMAATIEIHQGRRTVMEYLLSPAQRVTSEAGRER